MKEKELQRQLERIAKRVEKKGIVKKAREIAQKYGDYKSEVYPYRIKVNYNFTGKDYLGKELVIQGSSGWSDCGGADQEIFYEGKRVFHADTSSRNVGFGSGFEGFYKPQESPEMKVGGMYIHQYLPGQWEAQLNRIYKNGPKKDKPKVVKPEEREVERSKLEELAARLPIRI